MKTRAAGELEMEIMQIIWKLEKCSINDVLKKLLEDRQIAYTTVATIMQRLTEKGILTRTEENAHFIYLPKLSKSDYSKKIIKSFLNNITNIFGETALLYFVTEFNQLDKKRLKIIINKIKDENK